MNRKTIFDAVRALLGRGFTRAEVAALDGAIDAAETPVAEPRLGSLSREFETGNRGPATVSGGQGDPGGVSYGSYQLSSRAGTLAQFLAAEGAGWSAAFAGSAPGSAAFNARWKAIAAAEPRAFDEAQHQFIARTHYLPVVAAVRLKTGLDLALRHPALREVVWSIGVQHGGAATIVCAAIAMVDAALERGDAGYDRALIEALYDERSAYVGRIAGGGRITPAERDTLLGIVRRRYPAGRALALALAMYDGPPPTLEIKSAQGWARAA